MSSSVLHMASLTLPFFADRMLIISRCIVASSAEDDESNGNRILDMDKASRRWSRVWSLLYDAGTGTPLVVKTSRVRYGATMKSTKVSIFIMACRVKLASCNCSSSSAEAWLGRSNNVRPNVCLISVRVGSSRMHQEHARVSLQVHHQIRGEPTRCPAP